MTHEISFRTRPAADEPQGALVLIHGRGADENDLFPIFDLVDRAGTLVGLCPRGPLSLPPGGAHWYVVQRIGYPDPETFHASFAALGEWLESTLDDIGVPLSRTVIGGFSQGAVMSYALALGADRPRPAGLLALSGFIPDVSGFELAGDLDGFPVAIGHGSHDPIISAAFGRDARDVLTAAGADVIYRESPLGHGIDPSYLEELQSWLGSAVSTSEEKSSS